MTVALLALCVAGHHQARPNILFCFADDWGRYASAFAKFETRPSPNQVVKTPNIDKLAARGALFRNAFVPAPSCTPCRSSLLSGRAFWNTGRGAILQTAQWDASIPSFPLLLKDAGYHIGKTTKVWSPGTPADAPFGGQAHAFHKAGMKHNNFSENATEMLAGPKTDGSSPGGGKNPAAVMAELLAEVRGNFDAMRAACPEGKPWLYWFGPTTTHRKWVKGSGWKLWGIDPKSLEGKLPKNLPDVPEVREDFADYLGEVQAFDAYVGALLKRLEETGELDRTLIVVSGDHGAPGFPGGKCNLYDFGTGVTLVTAWPGGKGGRVVDDIVSLTDLCPTFLEAGGVAPPAGLNSRSLLPVVQSEKSGQVDPERTWCVTGRERHVAAARTGRLPYPHRALRTPDFLYVRNFAPDRLPMGDPPGNTPTADQWANDTPIGYADMDAGPTKAWLVARRDDPQWKWHVGYAFGKRPAEELFDLKADPDQVKNVAADPAYAERRKELAGRLTERLTAWGDPRVTEAECRFDRPPFTDADAAKKKGK